MQVSKFYELGERIARLMESYGLEVSDLEEINSLIERAARAKRACSAEASGFSPLLTWPAGTEKYSLGPFL